MGGDGVSAEIAMKVQPWIGRRYFSVRPPDSDFHMLYVPSMQLRQHWEGDATRKLVLLIPAGAMVRITAAPTVVDAGDAQEYEIVDLRRDLLLHCHDNEGHPALGDTVLAVKTLGYWSTLHKTAACKDSAAAHICACAHCIARQDCKNEHGVGIDTMRRMEVMQMDHLVLTDEEAVLAGCIGSLQLIDVATRLGVFCAAESQSAEETARLIMQFWVPYYGVPALIISDPHSGFASEVMMEIRRIIGLKQHEQAAARAKGKVAIVERSNELLRSILDDGFAKGDITCKADFMLYLSFAMQRRNFLEGPGRLAYIQLWSGQMVGTVRQLAVGDNQTDIPESMGDGQQSDFMQKLQGLVDDFVQREFIARDEVARASALRRDKADQKTMAVDLQFEEGDLVSHVGVQWKIKEIHGEIGHPVTATVESVTGTKTKRVKMGELRRLATAMPVRMLPKDISLGSIVFWKDDTGCRCGGTVEEIRQDDLVVLARQQDAGTGKNWLPTWVDEEGTVLRRKECPGGMEIWLMVVSRSVVDLVGELTETHRVVDSTWRAMQSLNLV